uniref:Uncharacterized protein n=1 Tax=Magallana gigas TaxID=29159 RepID=A0A8W8M492_MAGGI
MAAYEIREAYQSSTNGSHVASLGCDGDMNTFSLTNYGDSESWSVILDKIYKITWIFIRIRAGSYESKIELSQQGPLSDKCSDIKSDTAEMSEVIEKIVTCSYSDESIYKLGNKLTVTSVAQSDRATKGVVFKFVVTESLARLNTAIELCRSWGRTSRGVACRRIDAMSEEWCFEDRISIDVVTLGQYNGRGNREHYECERT